MKLTEYFSDLIIYVAEAVSSSKYEALSGSELYRTVSDMASESRARAESHGVEETVYDKAQFAIFAWIDETVMGSNYSDKLIWQRQLLQRTYYRTTEAGVEFYKQLEKLTEKEDEIREVFFLCLALGFSGCYGQTDQDMTMRRKITRAQFKLLTKSVNPLKNIENNRLFPEAYTSLVSSTVEKQKKRKNHTFLKLLITIGPVVVYFLIFSIYHFILNNRLIDLRLQ